MQKNAYIAIGSNLGTRMQNVCESIRLLDEHPRIKVICLSHFYETEPLTLKGKKQNWYLNCVLKIRTSLSSIRLFRFMQEIENKLGRIREQKWGPRKIDLDLLFYSDEILKTKTLTIPHPELHKRRFVLEPLAEVAPKFIHPIKGLSVKKLLRHLEDNKKVVPLYKFQINQSSEGILKTPLHERL